MSRFWKYGVPVLAFVLGVGAGGASAQTEEVPQPTPQIIEVPGPTQRVEVEVVREVAVEVPGPTVEVTSQECMEAIVELWDVALWSTELLADIEADYYDYPDEDIAAFGRRVEDRIGTFADHPDIPDTASVCR